MNKAVRFGVVFVLCLAAVYYAVINVFNLYIVDGISMSPTYRSGWVLKCSTVDADADIYRGDVIIFTLEGKRYLKRVIGLPGESLCIADGQVLVDGKPTSYDFEPMEDGGLLSEGVVLGENEFFCLGDNRNHSNDSREFGPVYKNQIGVKVEYVLIGL